LTNYIQKIGTVLCYAAIVLAAVCVCVPIAAYNYVRHEVQVGNFGYEEETPDVESKVQMPFTDGKEGETPIQDL